MLTRGCSGDGEIFDLLGWEWLSLSTFHRVLKAASHSNTTARLFVISGKYWLYPKFNFMNHTMLHRHAPEAFQFPPKQLETRKRHILLKTNQSKENGKNRFVFKEDAAAFKNRLFSVIRTMTILQRLVALGP